MRLQCRDECRVVVGTLRIDLRRRKNDCGGDPESIHVGQRCVGRARVVLRAAGDEMKMHVDPSRQRITLRRRATEAAGQEQCEQETHAAV